MTIGVNWPILSLDMTNTISNKDWAWVCERFEAGDLHRAKSIISQSIESAKKEGVEEERKRVRKINRGFNVAEGFITDNLVENAKKELIEEIKKELKNGAWPMFLRNNITDFIEAERIKKIRVQMRNEIIDYLDSLSQKNNE